ncbi:glycerate kinase type-2 family protein [Amaricoccus solimangrovi]|uniref:Glycerate kinase n=1 Tax=Amaricoccus solimangrovi TaxID=2589815 RepID=A0A501WJE7_9RHOB|nr:glycerate kinase [Amaricoccus solimangrovi]TPE48555.1 glycerate kinase [Amaricoccus solimangrovi]
MTSMDPRALLRALFDAAVRAALPDNGIRAHLPEPPKGRTVVVGAGKGAAQLAQALERAWEGPLSGAVVTRYGYAAPCERIAVLEAAHPEPDEAGLIAARRLFDEVAGLGPDDLVIALICGGGSALLPCPPEGLGLADELAVNRALLASGAPIGEMNTLRKHVSEIKGGRLARAARPARVASLVVSDIPGDDPALVASGPTVPGAGGPEEARAVVARHGLDLPEAVRAWLEGPDCAAPAPEDPDFARDTVAIIASAGVSLEAAREEAARLGHEAVILSDAIEGESRDVALVLAALAREIATRDRPFRRPVILLSGGETTVTLRAKGGKGGRNAEFLLAFALAVEGVAGITALAADTDGIDGSEDNAGGLVDGETVARIRAAGADPRALLDGNDAWTALSLAGNLLVTGPTGTNVNDFRAILIT